MAGAKVPTAEEVTAYLAGHRLEATIEEAVNDAVLKQVSNPFQHIAELLLKKAATVGSDKNVSIGGKVGFSSEVAIKEASGEAATEEALTREHPTKKDVKLKPELEAKLKAFFKAMDADGDGSVTKAEAVAFWGKNFAKARRAAPPARARLARAAPPRVLAPQRAARGVAPLLAVPIAQVNAQSMFNEVDEDGARPRLRASRPRPAPARSARGRPSPAPPPGRPHAHPARRPRAGNEVITWDEFIAFWQNVVGSGYDEADLEEEVEDMAKGASWVDFNDGRTT